MNEPVTVAQTGAAAQRSVVGFDLSPPTGDQYKALTAALSRAEAARDRILFARFAPAERLILAARALPPDEARAARTSAPSPPA
jgi:hypothetical protein